MTNNRKSNRILMLSKKPKTGKKKYMPKQFIGLMSLNILLLLLSSCQNATEKSDTKTQDTSTLQKIGTQSPVMEKVLTKAEQDALTPDSVIQILKAGNNRYINNDLTQRDHSSLVRDGAAGQYPKAVIISCLDSRVTVEDIFDRGIGDIFVGRIAGNFENTDLLGSMEFGCKVSGAKLILVLGHESCGAIKSAIDNVKMGNITALLANIQPAVAKSQDFKGDKTSKNEAFVDYVAKNNIFLTIENIKLKSPILKKMADQGEIKIVGAYYSMKSGEVKFL